MGALDAEIDDLHQRPLGRAVGEDAERVPRLGAVVAGALDGVADGAVAVSVRRRCREPDRLYPLAEEVTRRASPRRSPLCSRFFTLTKSAGARRRIEDTLADDPPTGGIGPDADPAF